MIRTILITVFTLIISCKGSFQNKDVLHKTVYDFKGETKIEVPVLSINTQDFSKLQSPYFSHSVGGKSISQKTLVSIKYDETFLIINFECLDNPYLAQNSFYDDNTEMYNQEVFEIFISAGESSPQHYWEIQLNPNNAVLVGKVNNQYKNDQTFKLSTISNDKANIEHSVVQDPEKNLWKGSLKIPLELIQDPKNEDNTIFRMNLYRIISTKPQEDINWKVTAENATFGCWNSTMADQPNFHRPDYFGFLYLN